MERQISALKREVNAGGDKAVLGSMIRQKTQEYSAFSRACKIRPKMERVRVVGYDGATLRKITGSTNRQFASGLRREARALTSFEISALERDIDTIGANRSVFSFNTGNRTGFSDKTARINVRGEVFPDLTSKSAKDTMSTRAVLAHEYYDHYAFNPSKYHIGDWRDEMRASYIAARNAPNLTRQERADLIIDAYDRARESGYDYEYSTWAKEVLYGY